MRIAVVVWLTSLCLALVMAPGRAQPPPAPPAAGAPAAGAPPGAPPPPTAVNPQVAMYQQLLTARGMDEDTATLLANALGAPGGDIAQILPLLMLMGEGGGGNGDMLGGLLFMKALSSIGSAAQPIWWREDKTLYIAENGVLYKIDTANMQLLGQLAYKAAGAQAFNLAMLAPILGRAQAKAQQAACMSNLKQLCLALIMYVQDHDGLFPQQTWAADILPYTRNQALFVCPARPDLPVGYAMNEELLGVKQAQIQNPAEMVLLFEANIKDDKSPVGGAKDVPEGGIHNGGINCGFADGHVKWVTTDMARKLLERPAF